VLQTGNPLESLEQPAPGAIRLCSGDQK
jgi:hypothetical protein